MSIKHQKSVTTRLPTVAVIGCGAAAREFCLPVLTRYADYRHSIVLVDKSGKQAAAVADEFGIQQHCTDFQCLPVEVDAAIVTTPHHLHAQQAIHFLKQGKPVFVEKPLGMSAVEVGQMLDAANTADATLMVNNCRRLFPSYRRVGELLREKAFGEILNVRISDGSPFEWSSVSDFYFRNAALAKGVFLDRGAHTVDVVCWWLSDLCAGNGPQMIDARHDAMGGVEASFYVEMAFGKAAVQLAFSRLYKLENCYSIECEQAQITGRLFQSTKFEIVRNGRAETVRVGKPALYHEYAWQLLENFIEVVQGVASPLFTAADVAPSIVLIDQSYQRARPFEMPWYTQDPNVALLRSQTTTRQSATE